MTSVKSILVQMDTSARSLARVQLARWGHPLTTGLPTIDGYISAQAFVQENSQAHYNEPLIALPRLGCSYRAYGTKPRAVDLPAGDYALLCFVPDMKDGKAHYIHGMSKRIKIG